jgi:hypothetical protein
MVVGGIGEGDNMKYGETVHGNFAIMYPVRFFNEFLYTIPVNAPYYIPHILMLLLHVSAYYSSSSSGSFCPRL